jgi:hypothetical protein
MACACLACLACLGCMAEGIAGGSCTALCQSCAARGACCSCLGSCLGFGPDGISGGSCVANYQSCGATGTCCPALSSMLHAMHTLLIKVLFAKMLHFIVAMIVTSGLVFFAGAATAVLSPRFGEFVGMLLQLNTTAMPLYAP